MPHGAVPPFASERALVSRRAGFIRNHLWVTPFAPDERYPAGDYVNQSEGGLGLPQWTEADRPVENTDIVVWHVFGLHHVGQALLRLVTREPFLRHPQLLLALGHHPARHQRVHT